MTYIMIHLDQFISAQTYVKSQDIICMITDHIYTPRELKINGWQLNMLRKSFDFADVDVADLK